MNKLTAAPNANVISASSQSTKTQNTERQKWDIFCTVIDNYGDIGVTWRLARQLHNEFNIDVCLWVDDLNSFGCLVDTVDLQAQTQSLQGIKINHWRSPCNLKWREGNVIIEAFACELPDEIKQQINQLDEAKKANFRWLNLEYLSAEDWIDGCHGLMSPTPYGVNKHFFFPGFTAKSGGLICENTLFAQRDKQQSDSQLKQQWLASLNIDDLAPDACLISVFSYENEALKSLCQHWQTSRTPIHLLVPKGRSLNTLAPMFDTTALQCTPYQSFKKGALTLHVLPMTSQDKYDQLLWHCDINIVRGEDSFIRAQWAAKPFIWHIYPQEENAHLDKLNAFLSHYTQDLNPANAKLIEQLMLSFNQAAAEMLVPLWVKMQQNIQSLNAHAKKWPVRALNSADLATRLVHFVKKG